jgi:hypothetical protein
MDQVCLLVVEWLSYQGKFPIVARTVNIGAIFTSQNALTGIHVRHVDMRHHFVCGLIEVNFIKIEFVLLIDNDTDIFTKDANQELQKWRTK